MFGDSSLRPRRKPNMALVKRLKRKREIKLNIEQLTNQFVVMAASYNSRHVQRVACWIPFITQAIAQHSESISPRHKRQLQFIRNGIAYKIAYRHRWQNKRAFNRGGFEILEARNHGKVKCRIRSYAEAMALSDALPAMLADNSKGKCAVCNAQLGQSWRCWRCEFVN